MCARRILCRLHNIRTRLLYPCVVTVRVWESDGGQRYCDTGIIAERQHGMAPNLHHQLTSAWRVALRLCGGGDLETARRQMRCGRIVASVCVVLIKMLETIPRHIPSAQAAAANTCFGGMCVSPTPNWQPSEMLGNILRWHVPSAFPV